MTQEKQDNGISTAGAVLLCSFTCIVSVAISFSIIHSMFSTVGDASETQHNTNDVHVMVLDLEARTLRVCKLYDHQIKELVKAISANTDDVTFLKRIVQKHVLQPKMKATQ